ncbi:hypothetical protein [Halolamina sp.]|uniref:hypothetical protein n=1 Tax=Halolamina sp. TaxID=1940283 RepID=UPI00356917B2
MIGIDLEADTLGGVTTLLALLAIVLGLVLLSGMYAILLWTAITLVASLVVYFGGRRVYRYLDEELGTSDRPPSTADGGQE